MSSTSRFKLNFVRSKSDSFPTGCSKYNPIEHRLFSQISINWAGKPLRTFETMLGYISDTVTTTGLMVKAFLFDHLFEIGKRVSDLEMETLNLQHHSLCSKCNYTVSPRLHYPQIT